MGLSRQITDNFLYHQHNQGNFGSLLQKSDGSIIEVVPEQLSKLTDFNPDLLESLSQLADSYKALATSPTKPGTFTLQITHPDSRGPLALSEDSFEWFHTRIRHGRGVHEPGTCKALLALKMCDGVDIQTIFDIGLMHGYFSLFASQLLALDTVVGFEMNPESAAIAAKNFALNESMGRQMQVVRAGVSSSTTLSTPCFYKGFELKPGIVDPATAAALKNDGFSQANIDILSLDHFCESAEVYPDLIKIDVEGSQFSILKGAQRVLASSRPLLLIEADRPSAVNHEGVRMKDIYAHLIEVYKYRLVGLNHRTWATQPRELTLQDLDSQDLDRNYLIVALPD